MLTAVLQTKFVFNIVDKQNKKNGTQDGPVAHSHYNRYMPLSHLKHIFLHRVNRFTLETFVMSF